MASRFSTEAMIDALQQRINELEAYNAQVILEAMRYRAALEKALGRELTDEESDFYMFGDPIAA